jgi:predicted TIM-barrel fold metal-dependent hydrolase
VAEAAALDVTTVAPGWDCHVHVFDATLAAAPGHYRPVHRPLAEIEALAAAHGVGHLVLVQPSVYGSDNSLLLQALAQDPGRHRGVVVLGADIAERDLETMHAAGVRGVRFNLVSPVGQRAWTQGSSGEALVDARLEALAPRLALLRWHVQWYVRREQLGGVLARHRRPALHGVPCVLDHLGGIGADTDRDDPAWQALAALAALGAWVKLSGWYRLGATAPYAALRPLVQRIAALFGERVLWGSDWPHTSFAPEAMPEYASTWSPVVSALGAAVAASLRQRRPAIYA